MRRERRQGLTLVELLVAVALSTIVVFVAATAATQIQKSIALLRFKEEMAHKPEVAFASLRRDLQALRTSLRETPPFPATTVPLVLKGGRVTAQPGDPAGLARKGDVLTAFTVLPGGNRALVQYCLEGAGDSSGTWSESSRTWRAPVGGGVATSRLVRRILAVAAPGGALVQETDFEKTAELVAGGSSYRTPEVLVDNVVSFELGYVSAAGVPGTLAADERPVFALEGTVFVSGNHVIATDEDRTWLESVPVGWDLELAVNADPGGTTSSWAQPTEVHRVRRHVGRAKTTSLVGKKNVTFDFFQLELSEKPNVSLAIPWVPRISTIAPFTHYPGRKQPPTTAAKDLQSVRARALVLPASIHVTLLVRYGLGEGAPLATFGAVIPVPRY